MNVATRGHKRVKKQPLTLREFIEEEMRRRGMGVNEFASLCGVGHSMISKYIKQSDQPAPTIKFLSGLAKGTGVPLSIILPIAYPELREELKADPEADLISRRIMKLRNQTRNILIGIIESFEKGGNGH